MPKDKSLKGGRPLPTAGRIDSQIAQISHVFRASNVHWWQQYIIRTFGQLIRQFSLELEGRGGRERRHECVSVCDSTSIASPAGGKYSVLLWRLVQSVQNVGGTFQQVSSMHLTT